MQHLRYIAITLFIIFGALFHGFFYQLENALVLFMLSLVVLVVMWVDKKVEINIFQILLLLFSVDYWIAIFYAQDHELALEEALKVTSMGLIGFLAVELKFEYKLKLLKVCVWTGSGLVVLGVLFQLYRQNRLESTIEYANTLAILLLFTGILCILFYVKERKLYYLLNLILQFTGLLLSLSRSVWILWIGAVMLLFLTYRIIRTKELLLKFGIVHLSALVLAILIKWDGFFFLNRVQSIQTKASELQIRFVYWKDSLALIRDYWLFGTGGDGWSVLLPEYSSPIYYVKYVHNQYLQIFMDVGLTGLFIFVVYIVAFYRWSWKEISKNNESRFWTQGIAIALTFILLHAAFDFELSFPLILGVLSLTTMVSTKAPNVKALNKKPLFIAGLISVTALMIFSGWLTIGYSFKQKGEHYMNVQANLEQAVQYFSKAQMFLPWSSKVHYDVAKGYVLLGNKTNNNDYYKKAILEINQAIQLSPKQSLYQTLLKDLNQAQVKL